MTTFQPMVEPTVFVLGAGASQPYGFPLGSDLKAQIIGTPNDAALRALDGRYPSEVIKQFRDALKYTHHPTIDIFLEMKNNFREIGAYFIAAAIGNREVHDSLFLLNNWYSDLALMLDLDNGGRDLPPLSIVTLNYDRSLEHFLAKYIDYNCRHDCVESAHRKLQSLTIVHAHGSLGTYPDVPYGEVCNSPESLKKGAENIKIVSDRLEDSDDFIKAQDVLSKARRIVFLGFGFNDRTLHALLDRVSVKVTQFYGTAFQLGREQRVLVEELFKNRINLGNPQQTCAEFIRQIGTMADTTKR